MTSRERMIRMYDRALISANYRRYFEDSGFYNFGYWDGGARSQREASEALVDELVGRISNRAGRILDVACGPGASTRRLLRYYAADKVIGINISEVQLAAARERAPGCAFLLMDAAQLAFPDNQFDAVMCVEAAFHFNTRERFLREALRVLKPGGTLVLTDMLFRGFLKPIGDFGQVPPANFIQNIAEYRATLEAAGFESVGVEDATDRCLNGFRRHLVRWPAGERRRGRMPLGQSLLMSAFSAGIARYFRMTCKAYLIASARKPRTTIPA
jgi:SAM-dependent methyltransferase